MNLGVVLLRALIDSSNPCAWASLLTLITLLIGINVDRKAHSYGIAQSFIVYSLLSLEMMKNWLI